MDLMGKKGDFISKTCGVYGDIMEGEWNGTYGTDASTNNRDE
jgi:hypothetical protein